MVYIILPILLIEYPFLFNPNIYIITNFNKNKY